MPSPPAKIKALLILAENVGLLFKILAVNRNIKAKEHFADNHFQNILSLFDVLPNFPFTTSETIRDY